LTKEELLVFDGIVTSIGKAAQFEVTLENKEKVICKASGKLRKNRIRVLQGDRVKVELSGYDLTRGRISYRY
tara:strand:- start:157 stop:372 length:216 start_codon:yes stop_codon:yes gene_type:complete